MHGRRNVPRTAYIILIVPGGDTVSKLLIIIGLVLTLLVTVPLLGILVMIEAAFIYRDKRERPDAKPLSKDEWKIM